MEEKLLKSYLKHLYREYTKKHGAALSELQVHKFTIVEAALCNEVPGMVEVSSSGEIHGNAVNVVMELKERGWIETDTSNFWLTPLGVHEAKISWLTRVVGYVNASPWIATLVAFVTMIVAIYVLFV
jgi:hypothetical protein